MKSLIRPFLIAGACLLPAGAAMAGATVSFVHPENYADMPFAEWEREEVLKVLQEHFEKLGKTLPEGQELKVEVLDLDLAGRLVPSIRHARELRVMKGGADWPHMHIRYTLTQGDKVLASGEERLADMAYLDRNPRYADGDLLRYEKRMVEEWFRKTFGPKPQG